MGTEVDLVSNHTQLYNCSQFCDELAAGQSATAVDNAVKLVT